MAKYGKKGRKHTGGLMKQIRKKRRYEVTGFPVYTKIGKEKKKKYRTIGGREKTKAFAVEFANVLDISTNKIQKIKILDVIENPANPHFVRRKIITKGAIIKTELGNARVTSRPSQHGIVNAILVEEKK